MKQWQAQAMGIEGQDWEQMNAPDPNAPKMKAASRSMARAVTLMDIAEDFLIRAMDSLNDTPMEARIGSFFYALQDLRIDIKSIADRYERGDDC